MFICAWTMRGSLAVGRIEFCLNCLVARNIIEGADWPKSHTHSAVDPVSFAEAFLTAGSVVFISQYVSCVVVRLVSMH